MKETDGLVIPVMLPMDMLIGAVDDQMTEQETCDFIIKMAGLFKDRKHVDEIAEFYSRVSAIHKGLDK